MRTHNTVHVFRWPRCIRQQSGQCHLGKGVSLEAPKQILIGTSHTVWFLRLQHKERGMGCICECGSSQLRFLDSGQSFPFPSSPLASPEPPSHRRTAVSRIQMNLRPASVYTAGDPIGGGASVESLASKPVSDPPLPSHVLPSLPAH